MSLHATHAVALLRGFADDYGRLLTAQGSQSTAAAIHGVAKEASDAIVTALKAKPPTERETEMMPHPAPIDIGDDK